MSYAYRKLPIGTQVRTGEVCPESGLWQPGSNKTTAPIARGNKMPPYGGYAVVWTLVQYG